MRNSSVLQPLKVVDPQESNGNGGGFTSGLIFGAFAGIAGMFLFGTKKGQKTLGNLKKHWAEVEPKVEEELVQAGHKLEKTRKPILQAIGEIVEYVAEGLEKTQSKKKRKS